MALIWQPIVDIPHLLAIEQRQHIDAIEALRQMRSASGEGCV